jgi:hypothetical protein
MDFVLFNSPKLDFPADINYMASFTYWDRT